MFCGNCGNEINDNLDFCPECGQKMPAQSNKNKKKKIIRIASVIIAFVIIIGLFNVIFSDSAEDVAEKYLKATYSCDFKKASKYLAFDFNSFMTDLIEITAEGKDVSVDELYNEFEDEYEDEYDKKINIKGTSDFIKHLGKMIYNEEFSDDGKIKVTVEITNSEKISKYEARKEVKDFQDYLDDDLDINDYIDTDKISKAYRIEYEVTLKSSEDDEEDSETDELLVVKYGLKWKVVDATILDLGGI